VASMFVGGSGFAAKAGDAARIATELPAVAELSPEMLAVTKATAASPALLDGYPAWKGLTENAKWAQRKYGATFSDGGPFKYRTVTEVVADIKSGLFSYTKLSIDIIRRGGNTLILNTRSSHALMDLGIPRSEWIVRDVTGDPEFEGRLNAQLKNNKLKETGIDSVRANKFKQTEEMRPAGWPYNLPPANETQFDWRTLGLLGPITNHVGSTK